MKVRYRRGYYYRRSSRGGKFLIVTLTLGGFLLMCIGLIALLEWRSPEIAQERAIEEDLAAAELAADEIGPLVDLPEEEDPSVINRTVNAGDTAGQLLGEWLEPEEVQSVLSACQKVYALDRIRIGRPYVVFKEDGSFSRLEYEIDDSQKLVICRIEKDFSVTLEKIKYDVVFEKVDGKIASSLFEDVAKLGESPALAAKLAEIFAYEINFIKDIQVGDSFTVLVEKRYRDGEFKGYGRIPAATFTNQGKKFEAYAFYDAGGTAYYDAAGQSLKRSFLKAPLSFTRISSGFNLKRMHPILREVRAHPAIDYAAPAGTPVKAVGGAVVQFSGWGKGAGNYVVLRHTDGYESMYLHLSGFAKGIKKGVKVRQGQVIGFVGSTGYSTGPHLDFRMKKDGKFVNPSKMFAPRSEPLSAKSMGTFKQNRDQFRAYMSGAKPLSDYTR